MIATTSSGSRNEASAIIAPPSSSGAVTASGTASSSSSGVVTASGLAAIVVNNVTGDQYNYPTTYIFNTPQNMTAGPGSSSGITPSTSFNDAPLGLFSAHFTGRQAELARVMMALSVVRGDVPTRFVLYAGPGVGKTQLTLALTKESFTQGRYKFIFWIPATTIEKLYQGFSKLLLLVGHPDRSEPEELVRLTAARRWLEDFSSDKWLLVLDNVVQETVDFLREHLPRKNKNGNILFTTRTKNVATVLAHASGEKHEILELRIPDEETATHLLLGHFGNGEIDGDESKVQEIVKCVGCLPLAIAQAAAYLKETGSTLDALLTLYMGEHKIDMMNWENKLSIYQEKSVAAMFTYQLDDLQQQFPDVSNLLKILAYFDPESIPLDMLINGAGVVSKSQPQKTPNSISFVGKVKNKILRLHKGKGKGRADETCNAHTVSAEMASLLALIQSPMTLPDAIVQLQNRSLTRQQGTGQSSSLWIHDLTRFIVLNHTRKAGAEGKWFEMAVDLVCSASEQVQDPESPQSWRQYEILIPHIQSLTSRQDIVSCANSPLVLANIRIAGYLRCRGRYDDAEVLSKQLLSDQEKQLGQKHIHTLTIMNNLVLVHRYQGRYGDAEVLYKQVLSSRKKQLGREHVDTLSTMNGLALVYWVQGRYGDAEVVFKQVLSSQEKHPGQDHHDMLTTMNNLALVYSSQGRYSEAEALFKKVILSLEKLFGQEHVDTLNTMNNLASIYQSQGQYGDAEVLFKQVILSQEKLFGQEHVDTLNTMNGLALVYQSQGRCGDAEVLFNRVLSSQEKQLGQEHVNTLTTMNNLADVYQAQGRYGDAEVLFKQVLSSQEKQLGREHVDRLITMNNLAIVYLFQGQYGGAEVLFNQVLSSQEKQLGPQHVETLTTMNGLALVYQSQGRYGDAEVLFKQVLSSREKQFGPQHFETLITKHCLALVYRSQGRYVEAEALLVHVLAGREKSLGLSHPATQDTRSLLADVLAEKVTRSVVSLSP